MCHCPVGQQSEARLESPKKGTIGAGMTPLSALARRHSLARLMSFEKLRSVDGSAFYIGLMSGTS